MNIPAIRGIVVEIYWIHKALTHTVLACLFRLKLLVPTQRFFVFVFCFLELVLLRTLNSTSCLLVRLQIGQRNVCHVAAIVEMAFTGAILLTVIELVPVAIFFPGSGQSVPVHKLVLLDPFFLGCKGWKRGFRVLIWTQAWRHPAIIRVTQNQALLSAHLCSFS